MEVSQESLLSLLTTSLNTIFTGLRFHQIQWTMLHKLRNLSTEITILLMKSMRHRLTR